MAWVMCENCERWRKLPDFIDPERDLPDRWFCEVRLSHPPTHPPTSLCSKEEKPTHSPTYIQLTHPPIHPPTSSPTDEPVGQGKELL